MSRALSGNASARQVTEGKHGGLDCVMWHGQKEDMRGRCILGIARAVHCRDRREAGAREGGGCWAGGGAEGSSRRADGRTGARKARMRAGGRWEERLEMAGRRGSGGSRRRDRGKGVDLGS